MLGYRTKLTFYETGTPMRSAYFIPTGQIAQPPLKCEGYPVPIAPDVAGVLPHSYGSKQYNAAGDSGYIVQRDGKRARNYDDSLAFGGVSGHNFLRRDVRK